MSIFAYTLFIISCKGPSLNNKSLLTFEYLYNRIIHNQGSSTFQSLPLFRFKKPNIIGILLKQLDLGLKLDPMNCHNT